VDVRYAQQKDGIKKPLSYGHCCQQDPKFGFGSKGVVVR